jgi:glutathione S-transferase
MDQRLSQSPYLGGEMLTYADLVAGVAMYRWTTMEIDREAHSAVEAWHQRLRQRQAFRDTVEVDYGELVGRLAF